MLGAVGGVVLLAAGTATYVVLNRPDYTGDPATMDPCGLFVPSAVSRYTEQPVTVVRDERAFFNECVLRCR